MWSFPVFLKKIERTGTVGPLEPVTVWSGSRSHSGPTNWTLKHYLEKWHPGTVVVGTGLNLIKLNSFIWMCLAAPGILQWMSVTSSGAYTLTKGSQVLCSVPKSFHFTKYCSFQFIILLFRISSTTHSSSLSMISGSGGGRRHCQPV